jgi:hypothetical protein
MHMFFSLLCYTRGTEGQHNKATYCKVCEGPYGELLYGDLEACSLRDALIVSNPRVAKTHVTIENWIRIVIPPNLEG